MNQTYMYIVSESNSELRLRLVPFNMFFHGLLGRPVASIVAAI